MSDCARAGGRLQGPAFNLVTARHLITIVQRGSPRFIEGRWLTPELGLLGTVVSLWLLDVVQVARQQLREEGRLWMSGPARALLDSERVCVDLMAEWLALGPAWLDAILRDLEIDFNQTPAAPQDGAGPGAFA